MTTELRWNEIDYEDKSTLPSASKFVAALYYGDTVLSPVYFNYAMDVWTLIVADILFTFQQEEITHWAYVPSIDLCNT